MNISTLTHFNTIAKLISIVGGVMELHSAQVLNYRCIEDSGVVSFRDITCLVGKNESGKTAFLMALAKFNPIDEQSEFSFDHTYDYPKKRHTRYKRIHDSKPDPVVICTFKLDSSEIEDIESSYGENVLDSDMITVSKHYDNEFRFEAEINEHSYVKAILMDGGIEESSNKNLYTCNSCEDLIDAINSIPDKQESLTEFIASYKSDLDIDLDIAIWTNKIQPNLPQFFYFSDYSVMQGTVSIQNLIKKSSTHQLDEGEKSLLQFLDYAGLNLSDFIKESNRERIIADLEGAQNSLSEEVFSYWSQNDQLRIKILPLDANESDPPPLNSGKILQLRIENLRHGVTVSFDERSKGFVWFFSFLAYFTLIEEHGDNVILLLDEPGLSLHALAQNDFLTFIYDRLLPNHQVVYTTHSPFMVDLKRMESIRLVYDDKEKGTVVTNDGIYRNKGETFPLQAALGYDLTQTLFLGPYCLLVEGPSEQLVLNLISDLCRENSLDYLDPRWVITNCGSIDKMPAFISLFGSNDLTLGVLIDSDKRVEDQVRTLRASKHISKKEILKISKYTPKKESSIEDLFDESFYLDLVYDTFPQLFVEKPTVTKLGRGQMPVVGKINQFIRDHSPEHLRFNHYAVFERLLVNFDVYRSRIKENTLKRFSSLFSDINELLPKS